ncbi:paired domain-containing protein [Trichonephila clavipes]|nr:paired domain-containing protein [Trichonephila clavipes]
MWVDALRATWNDSKESLRKPLEYLKIGKEFVCQCRPADAARHLNVSGSVFHRLWNQYQTESSVSRRHAPGWPRVTSPTGDHFNALSARGRISAQQLVTDHSAAAERTTFTITVLRRFNNSCAMQGDKLCVYPTAEDRE